jgi:sulfur-oxidizing protein SoxY
MVDDPRPTRRGLIAGASAVVAAGAFNSLPASSQQILDTRGLDPLWRTADEAMNAFFGPVSYRRDGMDLDLPEHTDAGSSVPLTIRIPAAMTPQDYPRVVHVLAHLNPAVHVLSAWFTPQSGRAELSTRIRLERTQTVTAIAQMSDGRHLRVDRDVSVAFGACAQIGTGTDEDIFNFQPQSRVSVPATAKRGEIVPVRALISHPMETGLRSDQFQEWVRQRIVSRFGCVYAGVEVLRVRLYPAVATNPYFSFFARAETSGDFAFSWYDMTDKTYENRAAITVS